MGCSEWLLQARYVYGDTAGGDPFELGTMRPRVFDVIYSRVTLNVEGKVWIVSILQGTFGP